MYIPKPFEMKDSTVITNFIEDHSFGIMMSTVDEQPLATHLPFLYDAEQNVLWAHMAMANPH